jgi:hypothetical protein
MSVSLNQSPKTIMNARVNAQYYRKQRGWVSISGYVHRVRRVSVEMRQAFGWLVQNSYKELVELGFDPALFLGDIVEEVGSYRPPP